MIPKTYKLAKQIFTSVLEKLQNPMNEKPNTRISSSINIEKSNQTNSKSGHELKKEKLVSTILKMRQKSVESMGKLRRTLQIFIFIKQSF